MALREHEIYWERRSNREENSSRSIKKCASYLSGSSQRLTLRVVLKYQVTVFESKGSCLDLVLDKRGEMAEGTGCVNSEVGLSSTVCFYQHGNGLLPEDVVI